MMYIDQAPLGGNLLKIIKNSTTLNNGTVIELSSGSRSRCLPNECDNKGIRAKLQAINGEFSIPNGNHRERERRSVETIKASIIRELNKEQRAVKEKQEEEEDFEQYELLDVIEGEELNEEIVTKKNHKVGCEFIPNGYKIRTNEEKFLNNNTGRGNKKEEDNCTNIEIRFVKTPDRRLSNQSQRSNRRPVPGAIPIENYSNQTKTRLINGSTSQAKGFTYDIEDSEDNNKHTYNYVDSNFVKSKNLPYDDQMGIDIFGGIRNFFNWKPKTANSETLIAKRKRSFENFPTEAVTAPHQIKYRKVENSFPKIITRALDDDVDGLTSYASNLNRQRLPAEVPELFYSYPNNIEMTQRGSEGNQRRSLFSLPQTKKKIVRNTAYADLEFSDDDDDNNQPRFLQQNYVFPTAFGSVRKQPKVVNIPIHNEKSRPMGAIPKVVPFAAQNFVQPPKKPTYAEITRQTGPILPFGGGLSGNMLGGRTGSSNSSSVGGASTSRYCNGLDNTSRISSKALGRSILLKDREKAEHEKYKLLLQTILKPSEFLSSRAQSRNTSQSLSSTANSKKKSRLNSKFGLTSPITYRAPLSSTINIDVDHEDSSDELTITGVTHLKPTKPIKRRDPAPVQTVVIDNDDDDISEIIHLDDDEPKRKTVIANDVIDLDAKENKNDDLPYVEPVNSFRDLLNTTSYFKNDWLQSFNSKWEDKLKRRQSEINKTLEISEKLSAERRSLESELQERLRDFRIVDPELLVVDDFEEPEVEEEPEFPELNEERQARIKAAICGSPDQVLVEKFNLRVTRRDIHTLLGHSWLNDEVINFYMNLITERSELKHKSHGYPTVYAMNTFFLQRLKQSGHAGVKRWTRKVNIFEKDVIPVPVHVGGIHWCMAIIHMKNRWIRYYDSMGTPNPTVLKELEQYLKDESLDKRKQPFDTSNFAIESVRDVPRQMNGSDCGVFSCMFAEYISRNKEITFSQQHMEYFRHKMILEIVQGEMLL